MWITNVRRVRFARLLQSRATASQAEKKIRQLEKVIDDGEQKLTELLDEMKDAHDEERRMNAEITKLRLQLDESSSAVEFAKKDCKKLAGTTGREFIRCHQSVNNNFIFCNNFFKDVIVFHVTREGEREFICEET